MSVAYVCKRRLGAQQHFFIAPLGAVHLISYHTVSARAQLTHIYMLAVLRRGLLYHYRRDLPTVHHDAVHPARIYSIIRHHYF